ncbi:MAG: glutathione-regulated potassium-efflux system protein KefC, partial [Alphaproteobacteria bacterium]|nr:glutathione-regulated potassium-efflux system protein KefC [Alphaproteobacteria bacterium]
EATLHFAEFGVVLLLFLVGLELNPQRLWSLRRSIFGMGTLQVVVTMFAVAGAGVALGQPFAVSLVAGMGFAMSSTAIALATLEEKNLLPTPGGQASFAVLLFQDLAVIPLMLALSLMASGHADKAGFDLMAAGRAVGLIVLLVVAGRYLLRPVLRYVANTGLREIFIAFSLLLVIGIALLMQSVGLSAALGTFLAGVLLADSEYRHELELDIEPFKGLLLGLFFISVGTSVDLGLFIRVPLVVFGLALGIVAMKVALLYAIARGFRLCGADGVLFALGLSQIGEFAFVLFGVATAGGILTRGDADVLNAAVAASMLTTPLLMILYEKVIVPRLAVGEARAADVIDEHNPVIVAGYGRFGQVVGRLLNARGIGTTVIDHDPNQIELVRRFGQKAYYGDVTRLDLLEAAGAASAKLLVVAVDDKAAAMATTLLARQHFPALAIIARAYSRTDAFEYAELGIPAVRAVAERPQCRFARVDGRAEGLAHGGYAEFRVFERVGAAVG